MKVEAIFGPPGTGKTNSLMDIAFREAMDQARGILYLSYTKAAAAEATDRVKAYTKNPGVMAKIVPSTLHSLAFQSLNMNRAAVVDKIKLAEFAKATGIPFMGSEAGSDEPQEGDQYATVLEFAHNRIMPPQDAWDLFGRPGTQARFERFVVEYESWKKTYGYMDFDDMLDHYTKLQILPRQPEVVILDEAQDCTPLQWQALIHTVANAKRVYIAGDDDQAIYEWSGANPHGMRDYADEMNGKVTILPQSHRVPEVVHCWVHQKFLSRIKLRVEKEFKPRPELGDLVASGDIWDLDLEKLQKKDGAMILARDRWRMGEIKKELNRQMLPYDVLGGSSPWTNKTAEALRAGQKPEIPPHWANFYRHADLQQPVRLILSTIHQSKGREHKNVVLDCQMTTRVEADIYRNPDAELRVWYVGATRAKETLHICGGNPLV